MVKIPTTSTTPSAPKKPRVQTPPTATTLSEDEVENASIGYFNADYKRKRVDREKATKEAERRLTALRVFHPLSTFNPLEADMDS